QSELSVEPAHSSRVHDVIGRPGDLDREAQMPRTHQTIDDIQEWIDDVNHGGDPTAERGPERLVNCVPVVVSVFNRLSDIPGTVRAQPVPRAHQITDKHIEEATGLTLEPRHPDDIAQALRDAKEGVHTVVVVDYENGEQHGFNAYFDGKNVFALDGQDGTVEAWPPKEILSDSPVRQWWMGTPGLGLVSEGPPGSVGSHRSVPTGRSRGPGGVGLTRVDRAPEEGRHAGGDTASAAVPTTRSSEASPSP